MLVRPGRLLRRSVGAADPGAFIAALGPAAWYRYNRGITSSGGAVSQWADQSGNGRHLVQTTEAAKPTADSDGSLLFDGVNDNMQVAFTLAQPETVFLLWKQRTWDGAGDVSFDGYNDVTMGTQDFTSSPDQRVLPGFWSYPGGAIDAWVAHGYVFNGASSSIQRNLGSATTGTITETTPAGGITLGSRGAGNSFKHVNIREAIIFDKVLSGANFTAVMTYLMSVGGIS